MKKIFPRILFNGALYYTETIATSLINRGGEVMMGPPEQPCQQNLTSLLKGQCREICTHNILFSFKTSSAGVAD